MTKGLLGALCALVLGLASEARASGWILLALLPQPGDVYLSGGLLLNGTARPGGSLGLGADVSLHYFVPGDHPVSGVGVFGQWQKIDGNHRRLCFGTQATWLMLGGELGVTHESESPSAAATTSVHVAPFLTVGLFAVGLRVDVPVRTQPGDKPGHGVDVGITFALKLPIPVYKNPGNR